MKKLISEDFNLKRTLECGQIFRYELLNGYYYLILGNKVLKLAQNEDELFYSCNEDVEKNFIRRFFGLDQDYTEIILSISKDGYIKEAIKGNYGIRILKQDPWECTISYICSSNSSIQGVKRRVDNLARHFGKKIKFDNLTFYAFPGKIDNAEIIKKAKLGYRAPYVLETANTATKNYLRNLKNKNYEDAKKELMNFKGIGDKVADCIMLFSMDFAQAFPVDRWIKRIIEEKYLKNQSTNKKIREFGMKYFGNHAGYAQQFLFEAARKNKKLE